MRFRASSMPRVIKCPGSKFIQEAYPKPGGSEANEGTVAHKIAALVLTEKNKLVEFLDNDLDNVYVDQEMLHHIEMYINECTTPSGFIEKSLKEEYHGNILTGTPDYWSFDTQLGVLAVKDLKYGFGWVEAFENYQLLTYASLLYFKLPNPELCKTIELTIVQPRGGHPEGPVRTWTFDADLIRNYRNHILNAMGEASLGTPPTKSGSHCRYCSGLLHCHAQGAAADFAIDYACEAGKTDMTIERFSSERSIVERASKLLEQRLIALDEEGLAMIKAGKIIPGWEARSTLGNLAWSQDALAVGDAMGVDLRKPEVAITPAQAISRKLLTEDTVKMLATRGMGSPKLKRVDHARAKRIIESCDK